jgi:hypothetical protein
MPVIPPAKTTHACPGQCGRQVEYGRLACTGDWHRLVRHEPELAAAIRRAWHHRGRNSEMRMAHIQLIGQAYKWFKANPAPAALRKRAISGQRADFVIVDELQ